MSYICQLNSAKVSLTTKDSYAVSESQGSMQSLRIHFVFVLFSFFFFNYFLKNSHVKSNSLLEFQ